MPRIPRLLAQRPRLLGTLAGVGLVAAGAGAYQLASDTGGAAEIASAPASQRAAAPPVVSASGLEQRMGVRIVHVALTGGNGLVDLRYQVVDPEKADAIHETPPEMVDERTSVVVDNLLMGHQHKGALNAGQTYYLIFLNPGNLVERGDLVTLALGGLRLPHVPVG